MHACNGARRNVSAWISQHVTEIAEEADKATTAASSHLDPLCSQTIWGWLCRAEQPKLLIRHRQKPFGTDVTHVRSCQGVDSVINVRPLLPPAIYGLREATNVQQCKRQIAVGVMPFVQVPPLKKPGSDQATGEPIGRRNVGGWCSGGAREGQGMPSHS